MKRGQEEARLDTEAGFCSGSPGKVRGVLLWLVFYMSSWLLHGGCFVWETRARARWGGGRQAGSRAWLAEEGSGLSGGTCISPVMPNVGNIPHHWLPASRRLFPESSPSTSSAHNSPFSSHRTSHSVMLLLDGASPLSLCLSTG